MAVSDWVPIVSVLGSVAVGLGVPYIVTGHERRNLRADVLRSLGEVEQLRWEPSEWDAFRQAVFRLRSAALVARADRQLVDHYIYLAVVARRESDVGYVERGGDGGGIPGGLGDLVTGAARLLAEHLWHPRRRVRPRLDQSREAVTAWREQEEGLHPRPIDWDGPLF